MIQVLAVEVFEFASRRIFRVIYCFFSGISLFSNGNPAFIYAEGGLCGCFGLKRHITSTSSANVLDDDTLLVAYFTDPPWLPYASSCGGSVRVTVVDSARYVVIPRPHS